jgi:hypothetical protein
MKKGMTKYTRKNSRMPLRLPKVPAAPRVRPMLREQPERSITTETVVEIGWGLFKTYLCINHTWYPHRCRR